MSSTSAHYINSIPFEQNKYGSKNNIPIKAIGVFEFYIENLPESQLISLTFQNKVDNQIEELVLPFDEFKERFNRNESKNLLVLWLMPDDQLYDVTNIGAEGEWFFVGGSNG
jgi:hypothetical protein